MSLLQVITGLCSASTLCFGSYSFAAEKSQERVTEAVTDKTSRVVRAESRFEALLNYSGFDLLLPGKVGISGVYHDSGQQAWEFEYLKSEVSVPFVIADLGSVSEKRISVLRRSFWDTNSFSGYAGLSWNSFEIALGDETVSRLTGGQIPNLDVLRVDTIGVNAGVGNRWVVWKGLTVGADWIGLAQPLYLLKKESGALDLATNKAERDNVEKALKIVTYFPRFYVLKAQLGWTF